MHKNIRNYILILVIILFSFNSCGPEDNFDIIVSKGTIPTYTWAGEPVNNLVVRKYPEHKIVWGIITPSKDRIFSPVTHGIIPEGAIVIQDTLILSNIDTADFGQPLIIGHNYTVQAWRTESYSVGTTEFICIEQ